MQAERREEGKRRGTVGMGGGELPSVSTIPPLLPGPFTLAAAAVSHPTFSEATVSLCMKLSCFLELWVSRASKDPIMCPKPTWPCTQVCTGMATFWPCPFQVRVRERGENRTGEKWWAHPFYWTKEGEGGSEPLEIKSTGLHSSPQIHLLPPKETMVSRNTQR